DVGGVVDVGDVGGQVLGVAGEDLEAAVGAERAVAQPRRRVGGLGRGGVAGHRRRRLHVDRDRGVGREDALEQVEAGAVVVDQARHQVGALAAEDDAAAVAADDRHVGVAVAAGGRAHAAGADEEGGVGGAVAGVKVGVAAVGVHEARDEVGGE